jgi:hypothetical protein
LRAQREHSVAPAMNGADLRPHNHFRDFPSFRSDTGYRSCGSRCRCRSAFDRPGSHDGLHPFPVKAREPYRSTCIRRTASMKPWDTNSLANSAAALVGPTVCELNGPMPILKISQTLVFKMRLIPLHILQPSLPSAGCRFNGRPARPDAKA